MGTSAELDAALEALADATGSELALAVATAVADGAARLVGTVAAPPHASMSTAAIR
jgi:hypothetical protein